MDEMKEIDRRMAESIDYLFNAPVSEKFFSITSPVSYTHLMASGAKTWSAVYQAAGDEQATNKLLYDTAQVYLTGVRDNEGTPLLYAGF